MQWLCVTFNIIFRCNPRNCRFEWLYLLKKLDIKVKIWYILDGSTVMIGDEEEVKLWNPGFLKSPYA